MVQNKGGADWQYVEKVASSDWMHGIVPQMAGRLVFCTNLKLNSFFLEVCHRRKWIHNIKNTIENDENLVDKLETQCKEYILFFIKML